MKHLNFLTLWGTSPDNGSRMDRHYIENDTVKSRKIFTILFVLFLCVGNMWGAEVEFTPSNCTSWTSSNASQSQTIDGITFSSTGGANSTQLRLYSGKTHTFTSTVGNITKIVFNCTANGTSDYGPGKMSGTGYSYSGKVGTWQGTAATSVSVSGGQTRCTSIVVTYTPTASYTVTYNKNGGTGTMSNGTGASITLAECGFTAPDCKRFKEWNTAQGGGGTSYDPGDVVTSTMTLYAIWEDIPTYSVTLKDDNTVLTQPNCSTGVTLPSRSDCPTQDYTFVGWTKSWTSTQSSWTTTAPTIIPAGSYTPTADENLYPVYTKTVSGGTTYQFQKVTALSQINAGGTFVISNGNYYLPNTGTSSAPTLGTMPTVTGNVITGTVTNAMKWSFSAADKDNHVTITSVAEPTKYLYTISNNNGLRINTTSDTWTFEEYTVSSILGFAMKSTSQSRYCATYNSQDWRSYTSKNHDNYGVNSGRLDLYKETEVSATTTSYISVPNCCTPMGPINGSVLVTHFLSHFYLFSFVNFILTMSKVVSAIYRADRNALLFLIILNSFLSFSSCF